MNAAPVVWQTSRIQALELPVGNLHCASTSILVQPVQEYVP